MHADRIQIDDARLQLNLQAHLRTPAAEKIFEEFDTPWWMSLVGAAIVLTLACCMLPTIIWTLAGLQALGGLLRHGPLFMVRDDARRHPEKLRAIVAHGIIVGPDRRHALAVGTFLSSSEYSVDWLAKLAGWMGKVYASPQPPPDARPLWEL